jgi:superoxide dismutase, Cu-Zn family
MRRITKVALGGLAGCALILGGTQAANGDTPDYYYYSGDLVRIVPGPFDGAKATLRIKQTSEDGTGFKLRIEGIDPSVAGTEFGSHLHVGPCVEGNGGAAGGHYNHGGGISEQTEVWFDLVPNDNGNVTYNAVVPFVPVDSNPNYIPGVMSIVIHMLPTDKTGSTPTGVGSAGPRQACFPLSVSFWSPLPLPILG